MRDLFKEFCLRCVHVILTVVAIIILCGLFVTFIAICIGPVLLIGNWLEQSVEPITAGIKLALIVGTGIYYLILVVIFDMVKCRIFGPKNDEYIWDHVKSICEMAKYCKRDI